MKLHFCVSRIIRISLLCALLGAMNFTQSSLCRAESAKHDAKRIHKVEKKLVKYQPGTYLRIVFLDHSEAVGTIDRLQATSFTFTSADDNAVQRFRYADVAQIEKGDTYVGEGSRRRHLPLALLAGVAGTAAAGVIAGMLATH